MNKIVGFLIFGSLVACSGADPDVFRSSSTGEEDGTGGGDDGEAGGDSSSSSAGGEKGEGGSSSSNTTSSTSSSQGSGGCQPSISCVSVGAECGTILDDGCGVQIECPNNCTGNLTCGGGGDQFKCGCTPQTCLDLGAECGTVDDGCGTQIDCGGCGSENPYVTCGGDGAPSATHEPGEEGQPNICNGGCTHAPLFNEHCVNTAQAHVPRMWFCSAQNGVSPFPGCELYAAPGNEWDDSWCCPIGFE